MCKALCKMIVHVIISLFFFHLRDKETGLENSALRQGHTASGSVKQGYKPRWINTRV